MALISKDLLKEMMNSISKEQAAEMAIPSYLHKNPIMRWIAFSRVKLLIQWIQNYKKTEGKLLDFGCGTGIIFPIASTNFHTVYGSDIILTPAEFITNDLNLKNVQLLKPEEIESSIPDNSLDIVVCGEVLEHIQDIDPLLQQFQRKLKASGRLLVTLPTESRLYRIGRKLAKFSGDYHIHHAAKIHQVILKSGFQLSRRKFLPLPPPFSIYWAIDYTV